MPGVSLRRRPRQSARPGDGGQSATPVTVVFRAHTDNVARVPFLYYAKNYGLPMPAEAEEFTEAIIELCVPSESNNTVGGGSSSSAVGGANNTPHAAAAAVNNNNNIYIYSNSHDSNNNTVKTAGHRLPAALTAEGGGAHNTARFPGDHATTTTTTLRQQQQQHDGPTLHVTSSTAAANNTNTTAATTTTASTAAAMSAPLQNDSWVCRAYCFGERDALHVNGAISVHQALADRCKFINDITKVKAVARVVHTFEEARERFGISHVELTVENQFVSRADMFVIAEALRGRILYDGEEINVGGFTVKVNEMLRRLHTVDGDGEHKPIKTLTTTAAIPAASSSVGVMASPLLRHTVAQQSLHSPLLPPPQQQNNNNNNNNNNNISICSNFHQDEKKEHRYRRVRSGLVTDETLVNFRSLSAVHYIIIEISKEMWNPTLDGRITLSWVMKNFLQEYLMHQVQKHKASLLIQIMIVGRLYPQYAIKEQVDIVHTMKITHDYRSTSLVEEIELQCGALLRQALQEVKSTLKGISGPTGVAELNKTTTAAATCTYEKESTSFSMADMVDALTEQDIFVHAKNTCTIETVNLVLEQCMQDKLDRNTGFMISIISAGKGLYQITNDLLQTTCTRLFNIGIEKINIICMGRPPLHTTPLLEFLSDDETLWPQYHLHIDQRKQRFYERPEWARCFFYYPAANTTSYGLMAFELLTKEEWTRRHRTTRGGNNSQFHAGLGLPMAPLNDILLPVIEPQKKKKTMTTATTEHVVLHTSSRVSDLDAPYSTTASSGINCSADDCNGGRGGDKHSAFVNCTTDVRPTTTTTTTGPTRPVLLSRVSPTGCEHETTLKGEKFVSLRKYNPDLLKEDTIACSATREEEERHQMTKQKRRPFVVASWYCLIGGGVSRYQTVNREDVHRLIVNHALESNPHVHTGHVTVELESSGITSCGLNILDGDLQSGYMFLKLRIDSSLLSDVVWSPQILIDPNIWDVLMGAFSGEDNRLSLEEQTHFVSHFRAAEIFCRDSSVILEGGRTLILASRSNKVTFLAPEEIVFTCRQDLLVPLNNEIAPFFITVAHVQLRNRILFAIKPIHPYRPTMESEMPLSSSHHIITTDVLLRRRWQFTHPELPSSTSSQQSPWAALCHCKILPIYGTKSPYQRDCFFGVSTHQYAVSIQDSMGLLEYVLQRLHQQYQIVVVGSSVACVQWPREDPTGNARLDMSIGHQIHELKISETGQSISVTRMLHSGMYINASVTHVLSYSYLLLNYLKLGFNVRGLHLETQIGAKGTFQWERLDSYLRDRHHPHVFIPRDPDWSLCNGEFCIALLPEAFDGPVVSFSEFLLFVNYRFSTYFTMVKAADEWKEDCSDLTTNIPDTLDQPDSMPTRRATLVCDNSLTRQMVCSLDHKTGRTTSLESPMKSRIFSADVSIPTMYSPRCHCLLKLSWVVCTMPVIADWIGSIIASATRFRLRAVPIPSPCPTSKSGLFLVRYTVRARSNEEEPRLRRRLLELLTNSTYRYFPDMTAMNRNCRLLHFSGLCYVTSQSEGMAVARWYENPMLRTGQPEHQRLLREFLEAVQIARDEIASS